MPMTGSSRAFLMVAACAALACSRPAQPPHANGGPVADATGEGWVALFDGSSLDAWRGYRKDGMPEGWEIVDGTLARTGPAGDIITRAEYGSFELELEWKVGPRGNSGIFYLVTEEGEETYHTGPEMQILDDEGHRDGASPYTVAGAAYGLYPVPPGASRPAGEWNAVRIRLDGRHVQTWLNGVLTADYELGSPEWERLVAASKFAEWPGYGRAQRGHIGLQDHGDPVWFRGIRIRELP